MQKIALTLAALALITSHMATAQGVAPPANSSVQTSKNEECKNDDTSKKDANSATNKAVCAFIAPVSDQEKLGAVAATALFAAVLANLNDTSTTATTPSNTTDTAK